MLFVRHVIFCALVILEHSSIAYGFTHRLFASSQLRQAPTNRLQSSSSSQSSDVPRQWKLANDFPLFLNQCSLQSFLFLVKSLRDPQTVLWLESFTRPTIPLHTEQPKHTFPTGGSAESRLLNYHGLAALNTTLFPTWDSYFAQLLEQPGETFIVESHSKYIPDYEMEIKPASLCARILSVREQIAREFVRDLDVIAAMGGRTLESYWKSIKKLKESDGQQGTKMERENLMFLEFNVDNDYAPSPLRKGNFDLLALLATQEAINRVLNRQNDEQTQFLQDFYAARFLSHFTGAQPYGRADDFLEELLSSSPVMRSKPDGGTTLIDPIRIAGVIVKEREKVAMEWKSTAQTIPDEHLEIKRLQLALLIGVPSKAQQAKAAGTE